MKMAFGYEANSWERTWGMQSLSVTYCYNYGFVRKRKKSEDKNVMINNNAELNDSWLKTGFVNTELCTRTYWQFRMLAMHNLKLQHQVGIIMISHSGNMLYWTGSWTNSVTKIFSRIFSLSLTWLTLKLNRKNDFPINSRCNMIHHAVFQNITKIICWYSVRFKTTWF